MQSNVIHFNEFITHCVAMGYALFFMNIAVKFKLTWKWLKGNKPEQSFLTYSHGT